MHVSCVLKSKSLVGGVSLRSTMSSLLMRCATDHTVFLPRTLRCYRLVPQYDQINYDITPYLALPPEIFQSRVDAISDPTDGFHINITNGHTNMYGPRWWEGNPRQLASLVMAFSRSLPDLAIHGLNHLAGDSWIGEDLRREADVKVRRGECSFYQTISGCNV